MGVVSVQQWPRFVADAQERARDPATQAAIEKSRQPPAPGRDAVRPVYPIETAFGIAIAGGAAGALRAASGALLRHILPESRPSAGNTSASAPKSEGPVANVRKQVEAPRPSLPAKPGDLLAQGWKETTHPEAAKMGHRTFENPKTGEVVRFDKGRPGETGFEGQDHYHRMNPNSTGNRDKYLDLNGNPVARGSNPSHIFSEDTMTSAEPDLTQVSFHEAGLMGVVHTGNVVTLALEEVRIAGIPRSVEVKIERVNSIFRNGMSIPNFRMEKKDGEILTLRKEDGQILLAIQWDDFIAKNHEVIAYVLGYLLTPLFG